VQIAFDVRLSIAQILIVVGTRALLDLVIGVERELGKGNTFAFALPVGRGR
jgi:hypothetical protein